MINLILFISLTVCSVIACSAEVLVKGNGKVIDADFFGFHAHRAGITTPWPSTSFKSYRLWDTKVRWSDLQPTHNTWNFIRLDSVVRSSIQHDNNILLPLGMPAAWASSAPTQPSAYAPGEAAMPRDIELWKTYVKRVVTRYKGKIEAYEIWNEPNLEKFFSGTPENAVTLTCTARSVIKSIDPTALIVSPAPLGDYGVVWLNDFLKSGGGACIDIIGYHFYNKHLPPESHILIMANIRSLQAEYNLEALPIWNTETGWLIQSAGTMDPAAVGFGPDDKVLSTAESTAIVSRALIIHALLGVERFYWYAVDNNMMGLVEAGGQGVKKLSYLAYEATARFLTSSTFDLCSNANGDWQCRLIGWNKKEKFIFWSEKLHSVMPSDKNVRYYYVPGYGIANYEAAVSAYERGLVVFASYDNIF